MKKLLVLLLLPLALLSMPKIELNASQLDDFYETGNVFSYNTPYTLSYNMTGGPNSDMFVITVSGNLSQLRQVTFFGLENIIMLDPVAFTSGSGFYSMVTQNGTTTKTWYSVYDKWYGVMALDVSNITFTTQVQFYFHYTLSGGYTTTMFRQAFLETVSLYFNTTISLQSLIDQAYQNGYRDGADSINYDDIWDLGYDQGYEVGYDTGINADVSNNFLSFKFLMSMFFETFAILNIEILPNLKLGWLVGVPLFLGMLSFIIGVATFSISSAQRGVKKK